MPVDGLYPAIGMHSEGEEIRLTLDADWPDQEVMSMSIDNTEEEWSRMHGVRLNGQVCQHLFLSQILSGNRHKNFFPINIFLRFCQEIVSKIFLR